MKKLRQRVRSCKQSHSPQSLGQDLNWSSQTPEPALPLEHEMKLRFEGKLEPLDCSWVWPRSLKYRGGRCSLHWRGGVNHHVRAQGRKSFLKGAWTLGSSPGASAKTGAKVFWPPAGAILPGLFQFLLLQGQKHSHLATSPQVPSRGMQSLAPVSSFGMQALCTQEFLFCGGGGFVLNSPCKWHANGAILREIPSLDDRQETFHLNECVHPLLQKSQQLASAHFVHSLPEIGCLIVPYHISN